MIKKLTLVALLFSLGLGVAAQKPKNMKQQIVGLWQQIIPQKEKTIYLPFFKQISKDRKFYTFIVSGEKSATLKTNVGSYRFTNDSTLVEKIDMSRMDLSIVGKRSRIKVAFHPQSNVMRLLVTLPNNKELIEYWQRVE